MPTHKGIKLSIVSQWELKLHPEFPHPESSQFTYRSPDLRTADPLSQWSPPSTSSDSKADRLLGRQSSVSVYIPSLSGTRFWIRYSITESAAAHSQWYYFKLFLNGRHTTSWGTNAHTKPDGQVMRGLFDPSERWNYKNNGTVFKNMGTEARPFYFGNEEDECSAALDGGLIEVMVFRARGRKRKLANPEEFKNQEVYGIIMPSGGLLDQPQDARFYDWHLKDPKDNPFAVFKFHYRSWDSLRSLQLIPADHPRTLLQATPSIIALNGQSRELQEKLDEDEDTEEGCCSRESDKIKVKVKAEADIEDGSPASDSEDASRESISSAISSTPWLTTVFDEGPSKSISNREKRSAFAVPAINTPVYHDGRKIEVPISRFSKAAIESPIPVSSEKTKLWQGILDRPLPQIPQRTSSKRHSRNSSTVSHTPSISPSLLQYLDRDTTSPEPIIGIAAIVPVPRSSTRPTLDYSPSNYDDDKSSVSTTDQPYIDASSDFSPATSQTVSTKRQAINLTSPPLKNLFSSPNITMHRHRRSPAKSLPRLKIPCSPLSPIKDKVSRSKYIDDDSTPSALYNVSTLSLSESEWMCKTPSPVRNDLGNFRAEKLWSPRLNGRRGEKKLPDNGLKKKAFDWLDTVKGSSEDVEDTSVAEIDDADVNARLGNWI